ncbi:MAG: gamma-glutamylcyclotransferase family protein [Verrucomicrobiota bacterium]
MSSEEHLVFVYGTLRRGASNAFRMEGAEFVREVMIRGRLYRIDWYPAFVLDQAAEWVVGELWKVGSEHLEALDSFEGIPEGSDSGEEYRRVAIGIADHCNDPSGLSGEKGWLWEWNKSTDGLEPIHTGDWLNQGPMEGSK